MTVILMKVITDILLAGEKITPLCERASRIFQGCFTLHDASRFKLQASKF